MRSTLLLTSLLAIGTATRAYAVPEPPAGLGAFVSGNSVQLIWTVPPSPILGYRLDLGISPGSTIAFRVLEPVQVGSLSGFFASPIPDGTYYFRVYAFDASGVSAPSNEVIAVVGSGGCGLVPGAPTGLVASAIGPQVTLNWAAGSGCPPTNFQLNAGSAPGSNNVAVVNLGTTQTLSATVPPGVYYVRIFAQNAVGTSLPSNEVVVTVGAGGCGLAPAAPTGLVAGVSGSLVTLNWAAGNGCAATSFELRVGTASGLSNVTVFDVGAAQTLSATAPPGVYFVRVVARNATGASLPSNEIVVTSQ